MDLSCTQIIQTHNSHMHNTTRPSWPWPTYTIYTTYTTHTTHTTHTTLAQTLTHVQHSPSFHWIGNAQTQSCHPFTPSPTSPSTPHRDKDIQISHTPLLLSSHTPPMSCTSPARVQPVYSSCPWSAGLGL